MTIAEAMLNYLQQWEPTISLDAIDKKTPSIMLQPLTGAVREKEYYNGGFIGSWPFAIYFRVKGNSSKNRIWAAQKVMRFNEWLEGMEMPELGERRTALSIRPATLQSVAARHESGTDDYQSVWALRYRQLAPQKQPPAEPKEPEIQED